MNSPLLAGLNGAWAAVQIAIGAFFLQAYAARREEVEYLLFGLMCFALAVTDSGVAAAYAVHGVEHWTTVSDVAHLGAFFSTALNVHFVLAYALPKHLRRVVPWTYGAVVFYSLVLLSGHWWRPGTIHVVELKRLGIPISQVAALPTPIAMSGYGLLILSGVATVVLLFWAYRSGKREARSALLGHLAVVFCAGNDVLSVSGVIGTPTILPYSFLIYGFGVADTLLVRYRRAAKALEKAANELRQATDELTTSYLELSLVQEELFHKKQLASVGELAASIAHEVRNPLAIIVNAAASLKRPGLGADDRNTLFTIIEEETTRLNNLVTELLRYSRPMNVRREDVPLSEIFKLLEKGLEEKYTLDAKIEDEREAATVWADAGLLRLALQNLVDNACQAMPSGGEISIRSSVDAEGEQRGVLISVSDSGQGMDSHTLRRAMDPFFSTRPSGTGLGLPIAGRIAEAHGGRIEVKSRSGEGTVVTIFTPLRRPEQRDSRAVEARP